jgi:hypothetical protein
MPTSAFFVCSSSKKLSDGRKNYFFFGLSEMYYVVLVQLVEMRKGNMEKCKQLTYKVMDLGESTNESTRVSLVAFFCSPVIG